MCPRHLKSPNQMPLTLKPKAIEFRLMLESNQKNHKLIHQFQSKKTQQKRLSTKSRTTRSRILEAKSKAKSNKNKITQSKFLSSHPLPRQLNRNKKHQSMQQLMLKSYMRLHDCLIWPSSQVSIKILTLMDSL